MQRVLDLVLVLVLIVGLFLAAGDQIAGMLAVAVASSRTLEVLDLEGTGLTNQSAQVGSCCPIKSLHPLKKQQRRSSSSSHSQCCCSCSFKSCSCLFACPLEGAVDPNILFSASINPKRNHTLSFTLNLNLF